MIDDIVKSLIEQTPSLAVLVWLVYSLRQDVRFLTETIIELKVQMTPPQDDKPKV